MLGVSIGRSSLALGLFALVTTGILAATQLGTKERIVEAERRAAVKALLEIVPLQRHDNDMMADTIAVPPSYWQLLGLDKGAKIHIAKKEGLPVAFIVPATAPDGYSGDIKMIIGINQDGSLAGVRVLSHNETPGLGDRVELKKSRWILGFDGKSLTNPTSDSWKVKKDQGEFDQFTGATITPRAVVKQVHKALQFFEEAKRQLLPAEYQPVHQPVPEAETQLDAYSTVNFLKTVSEVNPHG